MNGRAYLKTLLATFLLFLIMTTAAHAAVGCDLNDPDRDVARFFPESSGYRTSYVSIDKRGGEPLLRRVESRLGDRFHGIYETIDVPYTVYEIFSGKTRIGYIHGVNQKGQFGGIQVFVALDPEGKITAFYIQKLTNQWAKKLRDPAFSRQFVGLTLQDFMTYDPLTGQGTGRIAEIRSPAPEVETDFRAALRAVKKNLILMDEFVFAAERNKS